jgi:hypothetical protein
MPIAMKFLALSNQTCAAQILVYQWKGHVMITPILYKVRVRQGRGCDG